MRALVEELSPCPSVADALAAFADQPALVLFDSALVREPVGRYSFLAADPFATSPAAGLLSGG